MSHVISTRLPDELYTSLTEVAAERERKVSEIIQEALSYYVNYCAEYKLALERLNNPLDEVISDKELQERLGWNK